MKRVTLLIGVVFGSVVLCARSAVAGDLGPPSGAVNPTMKSLEQVEPRLPVNQDNTPGGPDSVYRILQPGSYYLTGHVQCEKNKYGIEIDADDVTLDLSGFTVFGVADSWSGIHVTGGGENPHYNIAVFGGTVRACGSAGIDAQGVVNGLFHDLRLEDNGYPGLWVGRACVVVDCVASGNSSDGFILGAGGVIERCVASGNGDDGFNIAVGSVIRACTAREHDGNGIRTGDSCVVEACSVSESGGDGIKVMWDCAVRSSVVSHSGVSGIDVGLRGTITGNTITYATGDGILGWGQNVIEKNLVSNCDGDGVHVTANWNEIIGNRVKYNHHGIKVDIGGNMIAGNVACENSSGDWIILGSNTVGEMIDVSGAATIMTGNPWANLSY